MLHARAEFELKAIHVIIYQILFDNNPLNN